MKRRDFLKISAISSAVLAGGGLAGWSLTRTGITKVQQTRTLMGTIINMTVLAPNRSEGEAAIDRTFGEMERLVELFDHRQSGGPLGRLNHQGELAEAPAELVAVLARALEYGDLTGGAFDISVKPVVDAYDDGLDPAAALARVDYRAVKLDQSNVKLTVDGMKLTLDGIAKGTVVDGAVARLEELGYGKVLVEAGGDLRATGVGENWRVAIDHPRQDVMAGYVAAFDLHQGAAATSGDYMRYFSPDLSQHHIIDPRMGRSPAELASTTVIAPTATDADALSTAIMVLGADEGLALANRLSGVEALVVTKDLEVQRTAGFPSIQAS